ncbi:sensor histidine kinase [Paenibacillus ehimensis]|uniref:histidine kinase n=1 Tax=Paenibacillus ehimensis TaxID=79264 RepID=A0ABT8VDC5_9BACL|nr:ATP-binding protein [Paenibacillus ehimensis]MDO3678987.1 ATP-binding protein [Paenibacillus ehimensis]
MEQPANEWPGSLVWDGFIHVEVADDGKGMEPDKVKQLLNPVAKSRRGIGLSNTNRRLTQLYGQGLSIRSKPNEGTTVSFIIPDNMNKDLDLSPAAIL